MNKFVKEFQSLKCYSDIISATRLDRYHKPNKEISETMSMVKHLRDITLKDTNKYNLV